MTTPPTRLSLTDGGTLRDFITRIEQGIYIVTPDGRIVDANPALLEILRADSVEQLRQYGSEDLVVDPQVRRERRRLLAEHGWIRDFCYEIRCLDGSTRQVRDTVFTQRDDAGSVAALHGILDVVEREEPPLHAFFTGAPAGLAILDADLRFLRINQRLAEMHLLAVEDHLGRPLEDVLPGLSGTIEPILRQVLTTGLPAVNLEFATEAPRAPNGARVWRFSAFPVGPVEQTPTGVGIVVIDITDADHRERQARLDGRYLAAVLESAPLAMVTTDPAGLVVATNAAFERLFLLPREETIGRSLDLIVAPADRLDEALLLTRRAQLGERLCADVVRQRGDGASFAVRVRASAIVLDGEHVGVQVIYEGLDATGA